MEQAYFERVTRQTQVRRLLQKAVLNLCQKNYAECAQNLEVDGIICISFPDSTDQHVVKIHEKIHLGNSRSKISCDEMTIEKEKLIMKRNEKSLNDDGSKIKQNDFNRDPEDKDSMQHSYIEEQDKRATHFHSGGPVFPGMEPISFQTTGSKSYDNDGHSSKSKRKMFKVIQRKRNSFEQLEVLSDSDDEISNGNTSKDNINVHKINPFENPKLSPIQSISKLSESVENEYVVVKVENFDDDDIVNHQSIDAIPAQKKTSESNIDTEYNCETQRSRQWITLPSQDSEEEQSCTPPRESLITIDGRIHTEGYGSPNSNKFIRNGKESHTANMDNYKVRHSVGQLDLTEMSDYTEQSTVRMGKQHGQDFPSCSSPLFASNTSNSHFSSFNDSLIRKNRLTSNKGIKTLDNLFMNKCAEEIQNSANKQKGTDKTKFSFSNPQNEKNISMIDLHSTTNDDAEMKLPDSLSISLQRLITTHAAKEKKYFCRHCGKGFTLKCTRSRHEKTICGGGGEGQYRCHICLKVFTRSDSRCRHLWKTHGVKSTVEPRYVEIEATNEFSQN